jgi:uncharacterized protein
MPHWILFILTGLLVGVVSGLIGIGGGILLIPILVIGFQFTQQTAQGTSLAMMIPPIGIFAMLQYYKAGHVDFKVAAFLALGFAVGGFFGGKLANNIPATILEKIFGIILVVVGVKFFFKS